ncbi:unnamed protein product [Camellia sinensis]
MLSLKRIQMKCGSRRITCSGSAIGFQRRAQVEIHHGSCAFLLGKLICRLKSQWKQTLRWERRTSTVLYSYDIQSYSQNFDDGCLDEHISPFAPR